MKPYLAQFTKLPEPVRQSVLRRILAILTISALASAAAATVAHRADREAASIAFDGLADKVTATMRETMDAYEQVLRGGVALFDAFGTVSRKQWAAYVAGLKLPQSYPGIQGVGFAAIVDPQRAAELTETARAEGIAGFRVHPEGTRELNTTILYLEPLDWRNRRALGFDMYSEPTRRAAMKRALDTRKPSLSQAVTLLQETESDVQPGVLLYLPVFRDEIDVTTSVGVKPALIGFVYGAFRTKDLIRRVLDRTEDYSSNIMAVNVVDATNGMSGPSLFAHSVEPDPAFKKTAEVSFHGARWRVEFASQPEFERRVGSVIPLLLASGGLLLGTLAAALFGALALGKETAHAVADRLASEVEDRKRAQQDTKVALRELAHRVKNTLTIVTAIASQTVRHASTLEEFDGKFRDRLLGLSRVHDLLTSGRSYSTDLGALAEEVLKPYRGDNDAALELEGPAAALAPNAAIMLSMLLNELATNATKYGAWSNKVGRVSVDWSIDGEGEDGQLYIAWREIGGPAVAEPQRRGFGSNVIKFSIERSLRGTVEVAYAAEGVRYDIRIPWKEIRPVKNGD